MWLSNTATTAMMIPIAHAVLVEMWKQKKKDQSKASSSFFSTILHVILCYWVILIVIIAVGVNHSMLFFQTFLAKFCAMCNMQAHTELATKLLSQ